MGSLAIEIKNPSEQDRGIAKQSFKRIRRIKCKTRTSAFLDLNGEHVEIPASAVKLVIAILSEMAEGNAITLIPKHAHLTTQEGADMLNVSRPFFVKLLEEGAIPFQRVGNRRRVLARNVMAFKERMISEREKALQELVDQAQSLDMGY
ncbi:excisionase family DNA-binding protein [Legionella tunisiensis]|uniref:excisionase family DNA-binding protein n=1 Tax=Legionella tunisiensis TaxID=1034944 RepID=UPI0002D40C36|nr:excisionase family DNA-binding protein [Legionella tunisiensis]